MKEFREHVDDAVFPQCELLHLTVGVLDNICELRRDGLALLLEESVPSEVAERAALLGNELYCDECVVEVASGDVERLRVHCEHGRGIWAAARLQRVVKLHKRAAGEHFVAKNVMVSEKEPGRDQESCPKRIRTAQVYVYPDPSHGARHLETAFQKRDAHQIARANDPFEHLTGSGAELLPARLEPPGQCKSGWRTNNSAPGQKFVHAFRSVDLQQS